jgi:Meiotically up-regulated gene 113
MKPNLDARIASPQRIGGGGAKSGLSPPGFLSVPLHRLWILGPENLGNSERTSVTDTSNKARAVYVIGSSRGHVVKIGRSDDVARRLAEIQRMSPVKLEVLWQTEADGDLETALHRRFKGLRTHGEWFDFADGDPVAIVSLAATEEAERLARLARSKRFIQTTRGSRLLCS